MKFQGFIGPTYKLDSVNVDCQRCVNLYPEVVESGSGKEGATLYYKSTPGLEDLMSVGAGPIRLVLPIPVPTVDPLFPANRTLVVSGNKAYVATLTAGTWSVTELQTPDVETFTMVTSSGGVSGKAMKFSHTPAPPPFPGPDPVTIYGVTAYFADGEKLYQYAMSVSAGVLYESCGTIMGLKPSHVDLVDGYFVINEVGTNQFYVSAWNSPGFDPLSFASAEGDPDYIVSILVKSRDIWFFNERSTEVWSNTGNADFPFERVQGGFIEKGCAAPYSTAKIDDRVFWLGRDGFGQGQIYSAQGITPERISTYAIEQQISSYADISKATAYTYSEGGHSFYVINFEEATWVYDLSTRMWHERAFTNSGDLERHRADNLVFHPLISAHMVGDYESNKIYLLKSKVYTDAGAAITRMRVSPHVSNSSKMIFYHSLQLDMETGVGLDGSGQGSDPQVMMQFSNDGGHTWSSEAWASAGKKIGGIGEFKRRVIWRRLGRARDRVFKVTITDPVPVVMIAAELELEAGVS